MRAGDERNEEALRREAEVRLVSSLFADFEIPQQLAMDVGAVRASLNGLGAGVGFDSGKEAIERFAFDLAFDAERLPVGGTTVIGWCSPCMVIVVGMWFGCSCSSVDGGSLATISGHWISRTWACSRAPSSKENMMRHAINSCAKLRWYFFGECGKPRSASVARRARRARRSAADSWRRRDAVGADGSGRGSDGEREG